MRRASPPFPLIAILLLFSSLSYGQAWSGVLAPSRAIDWTNNTGIPGGIPSWPCGTTLITVSSTTINNALAAAANNTAVCLPAGSFSIGSVHNNRSNVVLRGAGTTKTTLTGTILMGIGTSGQGGIPGGLGVHNLSTLTKGSTVLTLDSTSGLSAGQIVQIDEHNNTAYVQVAGEFGTETATRCDGPLTFATCAVRAQSEWTQIVSVNSSTQITIAAPGLSKTYTASLTPQVFYWSTSGPTSYDGVEDLTLNANSNDYAISMVFCYFCWVKNVADIHIARAGIYSLDSYRGEIRDSYVSASNTAGAPTEYGIELDRSYRNKIENNILFGITSPLVRESDYGNIFAYNYTLNTASDNLFPTTDTHRAHSYGGLYEGNVTSNVHWDDGWGGSSHNTLFRTYSRGMDPNKYNYRRPVQVSAWARYTNIVANVLGDPTLHTLYQCAAGGGTSDLLIYDLGWSNRCDASGTYDATTVSSLMRWGNWDAVTYKANGNTNGIRYCTGSGAGNPACTASETASTDPMFPGLASPSNTFPASFYLSGKPAWFTTPWGTPSWPPIGPDVACTTNCIANTANHAAMIPAQLCYANTAKDGNGFLTAFDADACYANNSSSNLGPNPPSGLAASVH